MSRLAPGVHRSAVVLLMLAAFGVSTAYGMMLVLPVHVQSLGGDEADFGLVVASAAVPAVLCLLALTAHPETLRAERVLALAIGVLGVGCAVAAVVTGSWVPLVAVGVSLGTAWATVYSVAPMVVSAMVTDADRSTYFGYLTGSEQLGIGAGPVLAGLLTHTSWGFRGTFAVAGGICVLAVVATLSVAARTPDARTNPTRSTDHGSRPLTLGPATRLILRSPAAIWLAMIALFACLFTTLTQFQTTFAHAQGLDYVIFYVSYTIAVIVVRFGVAPRTARFDSGRVIASAVSVMTVAVASFLLVGHHPLAYAAASAAVGAGYGLALPAVQAHVVNLSDEAVRPRVLPIAGLVFQAVTLGFPLVVGWLVVAFGYETLFVVLVAAALIQTVTCWWRVHACAAVAAGHG